MSGHGGTAGPSTGAGRRPRWRDVAPLASRGSWRTPTPGPTPASVALTVMWFLLSCVASLQSLVYAGRLGGVQGWSGVAVIVVAMGGMAVACTGALRRARGNLPTHGRDTLVALGVGALGAATALGLLRREGFGVEPGTGLQFAVVLVLPWRWGVLAGLLVPVSEAFIMGGRLEHQMPAYVSSMYLFAGMGAAAKYFLDSNARLAAAQAEAADLRLSEERNRMARDLHDILGHSLTVISLKTDLAARLVDVDSEALRRELREVQSLARAALADVRATVNNYREMSLAGELARAASAFQAAGIAAELPHSIDEVDPELRELFAWCVREATTNVVRHARARHVTITVEARALQVADDGAGMGGSTEGNGLRGLRDRALVSGCTVGIGPGPGGQGTTLRVWRPVETSGRTA